MRPIDKDVSSHQKRTGQFMTPPAIVDFCLDKITITDVIIVEPSCGTGNFVAGLKQHYPHSTVLAMELDPNLAEQCPPPVQVQNFYDFSWPFQESITFVGNPPFRSPAPSLRTHKQTLQSLLDKHAIRGIKEEAVFFLVKTIDLLLEVGGTIHYLLPKSIFQNNSKAYVSLRQFLQKHVRLLSVWDVVDFPDVDQQLVFVSMEVESVYVSETLVLNGRETPIHDFYGNGTDYWPFQKIFKKTHLGSVPCESIFMSIADEPRECFAERLTELFSALVESDDDLLELLTYNGQQHGRSLRDRNAAKLAKLRQCVAQTSQLVGFNPNLFTKLEHYKLIQHRHETRWYFRHEFLKKAPFVYILNSNPCPSFYFPGNPSANSTDYFGFCDYDVNRNSGPGANRCVPIANLADNLHDEFKVWWQQNARGLDYQNLFAYLLFVSKSAWYKNMKRTFHRFYFGVPKEFDQGFFVKEKNNEQSVKSTHARGTW